MSNTKLNLNLVDGKNSELDIFTDDLNFIVLESKENSDTAEFETIEIKENVKASTPTFKEESFDMDECFVCLGYNETLNYVWSNFKNCLFAISPKDFNKNVLTNCFGSEFIFNNYSETKVGRNGELQSFTDYGALSNDIVNGCQKAGVYTQDKQKGKGVWLASNGEIVVNSDTVFHTSKTNSLNLSRIQKDATYIYKGSLGINKDSPEATKKDLELVKELINTFKFSNKPTEVNLMLGFIGQCFTSGVWNWLAHAYLFGEAGSGKTTLLNSLKHLLGNNGMYFDGGSSEAGVRQKIGINTCACLIDETEPERGRVENHLAMFRGASSGTTIVRGTTDQTGTEFTLKFTGLLAGVIPVELRQADKGRFIQFKLLRLSEEDNKNLSSDIKLLMNDQERLSLLGKKVQMFIINNYDKINKARKEFRDLIILKSDARLADTYSTIIALSYVLQMLDTPYEEYIETFDMEEKSRELTAAKDHDELLELLMTYEISNQDNRDKMSVINYIYNAYYSYKANLISEFKTYNSDLGKYGIRVLDSDKLEILFDSTRPQLKEVLLKTRFSGGNIREVLSRLDGVEVLNEPKAIGGVQKRNCLKITLSEDKYSFDKYAKLRNMK
jgi:energy-coupling factor transporter ATP-binding protein EcfA2